MNGLDLPADGTFWNKDSFRLIRPDEYPKFGLDPSDIPLGTFPALKHPAQLLSSYGGNAYGFGIFESYDRLNHYDIQFIQSIDFKNRDDVKKHHKRINELYRKIGILTRFSGHGKPFYLIPIHLVTGSLSHIQSKLSEIEKIVNFHKRKYLKERYDIGLVAHQDDFIVRELSLRLKEQRFFVLDSPEKLTALNEELDLVIITEDLYDMTLMERFTAVKKKDMSKGRMHQCATYILWKLYNLLTLDGELFVISNRHVPKTNRTAKVIFKTPEEQKNFALFTHIFKTRKRYRSKNADFRMNVFDLQKYLSGVYVEPEIISRLLEGRTLENMGFTEIDQLPYLDMDYQGIRLFRDQERTWSDLLLTFFDEIFLRPFIPSFIKREWKGRFACADYAPQFMLLYLGQKKPLTTTLSKVEQEVTESNLAGCPLPFLAEYRDSFSFVIRTLRILKSLWKEGNEAFPQILLDRLIQPLENRRRRFAALNDVQRLIAKIPRLQKIEGFLNPDRIEGPRTRILGNLSALPFFGISEDEIREIVLIVIGHSPMGRIVSGKLNEKSLQPISDLARRLDRQQALNLLRYCRLMTLAETIAAKGTPITNDQLVELFDIYESAFRIVTNRDLDWDTLMDEKTSALGGIHSKTIRKILMMTNHFEFLSNWSELPEKGIMEKESLADYDKEKLAGIEDVIKLVTIFGTFEKYFLGSDPLQLPAFCRKFLDLEFHGISHLFERINIRLVFILLWITANIVHGKVINYNPVLAEAENDDLKVLLKNLENEAKAINVRYLDIPTLQQFSENLYQHGSAFIVGTGFQLRINPETGVLDVGYVDLDEHIRHLKALFTEVEGKPLSEIPDVTLSNLEKLFSNLESFYQSHERLLEQLGLHSKLPAKQKNWYQNIRQLRDRLWIYFQNKIFDPAFFYWDIRRLYDHAPSIMGFIFPEFMVLQTLQVVGRLYLKSSLIDYVMASARKMQALVRQDQTGFQNLRFLHSLAQREFGPMATGTIGVSESQITDLEGIVDQLRQDPALFGALVGCFLFQELGRVSAFREKYASRFNPADYSDAGAFFLEQEKITARYGLSTETENNLIFLVRHHSLFHHILRGEIGLDGLQEVLIPGSKDLFDAFFVFSFAMLSAMREDLMLEDLAGRLFDIRTICLKAMAGETTFEEELDQIYLRKGDLFHALEDFQMKGLPDGVSPTEYLTSHHWNKREKRQRLTSGKMVFALERLFRLRGIRYCLFVDLIQFIMKLPLRYIYKKRRFSSIGYATFEKELFEALRLYNTLQNLGESVRHFMLNHLIGDRVRLYGYEKISNYLNYKNQIKLLLIGLLGAGKLLSESERVSLNFLPMDDDISMRYEAMNDFLNRLPMEKIWGGPYQINQFFKAKTGIRLDHIRDREVISIRFYDRINLAKKIDHMNTIRNVDQLKNYFHYSLRSLRSYRFNTEDYELQLEKVFEERHHQIAEDILSQTKKKMALIDDFEELYNATQETEMRSLELGFTQDQRHRLKDFYELRKDHLRRDKLKEIQNAISSISDKRELKDYWNGTKWYLLQNRAYLGKEFENLVAKRFDECAESDATSN